MTGSIKTHTPKYRFIIPEFDIATWHDYMESNFRSIDALLYNVYGINNFKGEWTKLTTYSVGDVVFVGEDNGSEYEGRLVKVLVKHTTDNSDNFSAFYTLYPDYYQLFFDANNAAYFAKKSKEYADASETSYQNSKELEDIYINYRDLTEQYKNEAQTAATNAANSETNAKNASDTAVNTVKTATDLLNQTQKYTTSALKTITDTRDEAVSTIDTKVNEAISSINTTKESAETYIENVKTTAEANIDAKVDESIEYVKEEGVKAAKSAIQDVTDAAEQAKTNADRSEIAAAEAEEALKSITGVYRVKGNVQSVSDLPTSRQENGDVYNVLDTGANYVWTGSTWDKLSETVDLSDYYTKENVNDLLDKKQDTISDLDIIKNNATNGQSAYTTISGYGNIVTHNTSEFQDTLVSGINIKTINSESILGSGNITIKSAPDLDNQSITKNSSNKLQTVAVIDNNSNAIKTWTGTLEEYNALTSIDSTTLYNITDDFKATTYDAYSKSKTDNLLENKVDLDLSNCSVPHLVSFKTDGTQWVKIYSNGWCEQYCYYGQTVTLDAQTSSEFTWPLYQSISTFVSGIASISGSAFVFACDVYAGNSNNVGFFLNNQATVTISRTLYGKYFVQGWI